MQNETINLIDHRIDLLKQSLKQQQAQFARSNKIVKYSSPSLKMEQAIKDCLKAVQGDRGLSETINQALVDCQRQNQGARDELKALSNAPKTIERLKQQIEALQVQRKERKAQQK